MKNQKRPNHACCQTATKTATKTKAEKLNHRLHRLAAIATAGMICSQSQLAEAGSATTFKDMSSHIVTSVSGANNMISALCWIGGAGLGVAGIFKLKNHVDNPGQTPMKDGLIRLACGGSLLSFPFIEAAMQGSVSDGSLTGINASVLRIDSTTVFAGP